MPSTPTATADHSPQLHLLYSPTANPKSSSGLLVPIILFKRTPSRWTVHITIHLAISPRMIPSEPTEGLPHFCGMNPKSYTLEGAVPHGYPSPAVSSPQNMRSGGGASTTRYAEHGSGVARPGESSIGSHQNTAGGQDLAAAASPGVSETTHHDCKAQFTCGWPSSDQGVIRVCGKPLSCKTASEHFKAHGIINMNKKERVSCCWDGYCEESRRSNFIRHIRESHLGHPRGSN